MIKVSFDAHFGISKKVFRRCDPDKNLYYVIQYLSDEKDVLYKISGQDGVFTVYHFEIDDYSNRLAVLN